MAKKRVIMTILGVPTTSDPNTSPTASRHKLEPYRVANGCVYSTFAQEEGILLRKSIAIEMGGKSRYFSEVPGSGVGVTFLLLSLLSTKL